MNKSYIWQWQSLSRFLLITTFVVSFWKFFSYFSSRWNSSTFWTYSLVACHRTHFNQFTILTWKIFPTTTKIFVLKWNFEMIMIIFDCQRYFSLNKFGNHFTIGSKLPWIIYFALPHCIRAHHLVLHLKTFFYHSKT